jgi:hypothetical protein
MTDEGTIECGAAESGQSGDIIVMPGGRLYALVDDSHIEDEPQINSQYFKGANRRKSPALLLTGGSSLINYGTFVTNYTKMDNSGKIENRKEALALVGYQRTDTGELLYNSKVTKTGVANIAAYTDSFHQIGGGIQPVYVTRNVDGRTSTTTSKGTVLTESTANLILSASESVAQAHAYYKTPEY